MYTKTHHALVDGVSAMRLLASVLSTDPDERNMPAPWALRPRAPREEPASDGGTAVPWLSGGAAPLSPRPEYPEPPKMVPGTSDATASTMAPAITAKTTRPIEARITAGPLPCSPRPGTCCARDRVAPLGKDAR